MQIESIMICLFTSLPWRNSLVGSRMASQWGRQGKPVPGLAPNFCIDEQPQISCGCLRQKPQCGSYITNGKPHPYTELYPFLKFLPNFHCCVHFLLPPEPVSYTATHLLYSSEVPGSVSCIPEKELKGEQPRPHLGSLCSPFSKATEGAWQETLPFCYCFCNCSFSPSISARPCPGTPIVAFILRSIKKGRRCPIKSKMVDMMIFHNVILWTFCAVAEIHRWLALDTASELLLSWLLAWKKPVLTRSWEMAVPYTMALSGWRLYSQDRLLGLEHILRGTAKDHIFCRGSAVLHKWDAGMPGVWCFA